MRALNLENKRKTVVSYVPHGINSDVYKPTNVPDDFRNAVFNGKNYEFVLFWMNRNIKRKQPSDVIWAFKMFVDGLPTEKRDSVCLLMHTQPIDNNGTDLVAVKDAIAPDCNIFFSGQSLNQQQLNYVFNLVDVTINIAGNEGFGLTTAESLMAGTPIIVAVTGGLQDQCGFKLHGKEFVPDDYINLGSLHEWRKWEGRLEHGAWVKPVWPRIQTMVGSVPTPYIIDDKVDVVDVAKAIRDWYDVPKVERVEAGLEGRRWVLEEGGLNSANMCQKMIDSIELTIENFVPKSKLQLYKLS